MRLNEVEVLVFVVVLLLQCADGVALGSGDRRKHSEGGFILDLGIVRIYLGAHDHHRYSQIVCECAVA